MEQKECMKNENAMSKMENPNKETLEAKYGEKVLSEPSDNSMNLPSNMVKDRGKIECDERSEASSDISRARNKQDFRETAKYRDEESYTNQHHHSIGEGLFMTEEIRDLPPRFRTKAEQALEKMCEELYASRGERQKTSSGEEACPICLDPLSYDFQRLEHCGHAFCRQCLLLQIESKSIPLVCVKQDCGKLIFLEDIKRIMSFGEDHLKKAFCAVALQYHVSCNVGELSYCRTPDCQMLYRVTKQSSEYNCPNCKNSTCTKCHSLYHFGMSCEMFQECQKDIDYSLKMWVKDNDTSRKYCPSCKAAIEKVDGCNHMECLNCKAHMCWLCLQIFETGDEVYSHMPYCPNNQ